MQKKLNSSLNATRKPVSKKKTESSRQLERIKSPLTNELAVSRIEAASRPASTNLVRKSYSPSSMIYQKLSGMIHLIELGSNL
jgi:hypothetical protein